jgi:hypothetical protein
MKEAHNGRLTASGGLAVSRREALAAALVAGGAASLARPGIARASSAAPAPGIVFGADRSGYAGFNAASSLAVGLRWYFNIENKFPPLWPEIFPETQMTLSLRPNPADLLAGRLDNQLRAIVQSAPPNSELTFWHENTTGNPLRYPRYVNNARTSVAMQQYGQQLCAGTGVLFGVITVGPVVLQRDWIARGLDWYGDDLYEFPRLRNPDNTFSEAKVVARLYQNLSAWQQASGQQTPAIRICETNSPYDSHRSEFFTTIARWLAGHNGHRMLTYWNPSSSLAEGGLSGPWPPSQPVISRLSSLSRQYEWSPG